MDAEWVGDENADRTLLYLHGGGYVLRIETHRSMVARLCNFAGIRGLIVDYRLAPEHPYPSAIEDAEAAYDYLLANGVTPETMLLAGDSAGGGLSLALMQKLREHGKAQPKAVALLSPWTDLTISGRSHKERAERDPMIDVERIPEAIDWYCPNQDKKNRSSLRFLRWRVFQCLCKSARRKCCLTIARDWLKTQKKPMSMPNCKFARYAACAPNCSSFCAGSKSGGLLDIAGFFNRKGV